jgi:hypothetical protein
MLRYVFALLLANAVFAPATALTIDQWNGLERGVLDLVNRDRSAQGLGTLNGDSRLHDAARSHSQDMAANNFFSHTGTGGTNAGDRIAAEGYAATAWGENIAAGFPTAESVVAAWLDSPGHRDNMRNGLFTDAGIGYIEAGANADFDTYWTLGLAAGDSEPVTLPQMSGAVGAATSLHAAALAPSLAQVPLPPSVWLFLAALATGLALIRRRRPAA